MPKYVNIGLDEMDEFLVEAQGFDRIDGDERREMHLDQGIPYVESGEHIYEMDMDQDYAPGCRIRIYSSIAVRGEQGRRRGADAIRVVIVDENGMVCNNSFKRVHRVKNWRLNLLKRYEPILDEPWNYTPWTTKEKKE
mgnify:CR=1 FL=1